MCEETDEERLRAIPVLLSGDTLIYYTSHVTQCKTYEDAIATLLKWYKNADKRSRIIIRRESMLFTEKLIYIGDKSRL